MNTRRLTLVAVLVAVVAAAAGGLYLGSRDDAEPAPAAEPSPAAGSQLAMPAGKIGAQGLSIAEARSAETPENLLVRGFLLREDGGLVLCAELRDGACAGDRLAVQGEPGVEPDSTGEVMLLGTVDGDTLVATNLASS